MNMMISWNLFAPSLVVATGILSAGVVTMHYVGTCMPSLSMRCHPMESFADTALSDDCHRCIWCRFVAGVSFTPKYPSSPDQSALSPPLLWRWRLHTGMGAATFTHFGHTVNNGLSTLELSVWVCAVTLVILGIMLVVSMVDSQLRTSRLADNLHQLNCQLEHQVHFDALTGLPIAHR